MPQRSLNLAPAVATTAEASGDASSPSIIYKSPLPDVDIPKKTVFQVIGDRIPQFAKRNALVCGLTHEAVTFEELYDSAKRIAAGLARDGVKKDDVVMLHSLNCLEYPSVLLALHALGATISPVSTALMAFDVARQMRLAKSNFVVTHRAIEHVALEAAEAAGVSLSHVYTMGRSPEPPRVKSIQEVKEQGSESFTFEQIDPEQPVYLPFSSGTTGLPKGVVVRARNLAANLLQICEVEKVNGHVVAVLPWFHAYPMTMLEIALMQGATTVVLPRFELETFLATLSTYRIESANVAPSIALVLAHHPLVDEYDLSATKIVVSAGAPLGREVLSLLDKRLGVKVKQGYGMTEMTCVVNMSDEQHAKQGSVGVILPNTELRVKCVTTDKDLPPNQLGELLYRGPQIMLGYRDNEVATKSTLMADGFLRTGDVGYIDDDGCVFVVDRLKELIKYGGEQVAPSELEDVLNHHPLIADSCVVRGYGELDEELPKAYVVRKDDALTAEAVRAFVAAKVSPFKQVRQVEFIEAIPKSAAGKILRRELQQIENERRSATDREQRN